jgi:predicted DCC family thiol-disulfide oxidoreductase YuxK
MGGPERQPPDRSAGRHLILYDGVCGFCNRANRFILARDPRAVFDFVPLQSPAARSILARFGRNPEDLETFYVVANYRSGTPELESKAGASLFVAETIGWPWRAVAVLDILPRRWLDSAYDLFARHRYRLFGRYESCPLPPDGYRQRFLDV